MPQNVNPRDGVAFGANLFGVASKEKSFVNCYQIHIYFFMAVIFQLNTNSFVKVDRNVMKQINIQGNICF